MGTLSSKSTLILVLFISFISTFPWLNDASYNTKGEPREALCAQSMLTTNNWILPERYDGIYATKPPFTHWLMATTAKVIGQPINEGISRFPSALAALLLSISFFLFVKKKKTNFVALLSFLLFYSFIDIHRTAMTARVDMILTACIVSAIMASSHWIDKSLKGFPWLFTLFMSLGFLTKGPIGVILPCIIFTLYALINGFSFLRIVKALFIAATPSIILPLIWYILAYQQGGEAFWEIVFEENFARFLGKMNYPSHNKPFFYPIIYTLLGVMPWLGLLLFALPAYAHKIKFKKRNCLKINSLKKYWLQFQNWKKIDQLALLTIVSVLVFYMIPSSKRAVYQLPAYPFIAYFLAQAFLKIAKSQPHIVRIYGGFITIVIGLVVLLFPLGQLLPCVISTPSIAILQTNSFSIISWMTYALLAIMTLTSIYFLINYQTKQTLLAIIFLFFTLNIFLDNTILPIIKNQQSNKPFATNINHYYPKQQLYAYQQTFWQINFYLDKKIKQLSLEKIPQTPFFLLITEKEIELFQERYPTLLLKKECKSLHKNKSLKDFVVLAKVSSK